MKRICIVLFSMAAAQIVVAADTNEEKFIPIIVELKSVESIAVAADLARSTGAAFNETAHARAVETSQDEFLTGLRNSAIPFRTTSVNLRTAQGEIQRQHRFARLINAIGLEVPESAVEAVRALPRVRHVTVDEPVKLHLDNSVAYVRARAISDIV